MRGLGFREHGGLDRVELLDLPEPTAGPGQVKVRMRSASFNRLDLFTLEGMPGVTVPLPHILGGDGAGVVESVGEGVEGWRVGANVIVDPSLSDGTCEACRAGLEPFCRNYQILGEHRDGTAAEFCVVPAENLQPLPPSLDFVQGGCVSLVFMTAYRALLTTGGLQPGEQVAIVGGGGGLNTAAIQIARWRGAQVVVATRSEEHAEKAAKLGAHQTLVYGPEKPLDRGLWTLSGKKGVDVVFDCNGTATVPSSARALARGGRLVFCGGTSGPMVTVDLRPLFWRQASLRGSTMATRAEYREVLKLLASGALQPVVDSTYPLERGRDALEHLAKGSPFGKVVLTIP
ncbi:MAG: zinc-binding dehydrogenase [Euryarchaeota archaeon]|nr:zinc-binding dehydrogenase [Euryarchaeota archaeon]MDE1835138.1 zinc-binding dehydrogenase [Euryarchaeota archaeon]MDE1882130.1 zinc-binding dehydrogenase [Euryarchaeota archaeon]MDE2046512.1 zinc-binding dehydrogenase [Thermoplasmata archaeon]